MGPDGLLEPRVSHRFDHFASTAEDFRNGAPPLDHLSGYTSIHQTDTRYIDYSFRLSYRLKHSLVYQLAGTR